MSDNKYTITTETKIGGGKRKTGGYSSIKLHMKRDRKRREAEERQAEHNYLTTAEKLAKATKRGGSVREIKRLKTILASESKKEIVESIKKNPPVLERVAKEINSTDTVSASLTEKKTVKRKKKAS